MTFDIFIVFEMITLFKFDMISYQISSFERYFEFLTTKIRENSIRFTMIDSEFELEIQCAYAIHTLRNFFYCIDFSQFFDEISDSMIEKAFREIALTVYLTQNQYMSKIFTSIEEIVSVREKQTQI